MSASEKLRALEQLDYLSAVTEIAALFPEIVAVVEAAERCERKAANHGGNGTLVDIARTLHPRLAALEEKLSQS